jgi:hypothetical protein
MATPAQTIDNTTVQIMEPITSSANYFNCRVRFRTMDGILHVQWCFGSIDESLNGVHTVWLGQKIILQSTGVYGL